MNNGLTVCLVLYIWQCPMFYKYRNNRENIAKLKSKFLAFMQKNYSFSKMVRPLSSPME